MTERKAKPTLKLKKKDAPIETPKLVETTPVETTPVETIDYETPVFVKEDTGPYDDSYISFSANRKHQRSIKQLKDRERDKHAYLDQYN
ncbi:MAG: hypothetical protein ACRESJ_14575 [Pseudomonas sp.]|uniref:hypothetical protein n=1 Tax=Pseudomonas sp. TaxID=306 RepID=UPI003D6FC961